MRARRRPQKPVTPDLIAEIARLTAYGVRQCEIALRLDTSQSTVSRIQRGQIAGAIVAGALAAAAPASAHDQWADGKAVPAWVKAACCGPEDVHHLKPDQVHGPAPEKGRLVYHVDGYDDPIPAEKALPSQDGDYWIFYRDNKAGYVSHPEDGDMTQRWENASQSGVFCFFVPMATQRDTQLAGR